MKLSLRKLSTCVFVVALLTGLLTAAQLFNQFSQAVVAGLDARITSSRESEKSSILITSHEGKPLTGATLNHKNPVAIDLVPDHVINAFICAEDRNFFAHRGINIFSISRAYLANLKSGTITQGASTITQQLVRLLFLNHNRTYDRKLREAILALALEAKLEKKNDLRNVP